LKFGAADPPLRKRRRQPTPEPAAERLASALPDTLTSKALRMRHRPTVSEAQTTANGFERHQGNDRCAEVSVDSLEFIYKE